MSKINHRIGAARLGLDPAPDRSWTGNVLVTVFEIVARPVLVALGGDSMKTAEITSFVKSGGGKRLLGADTDPVIELHEDSWSVQGYGDSEYGQVEKRIWEVDLLDQSPLDMED